MTTILCLVFTISVEAKSTETKVDGIPIDCISEDEKLKNSLYFARTYAADGQKDKALVLLAHAEKEAPQMEDEYVFLQQIASIYLKLGYKDKALNFLKKLQATRPKTPEEVLIKDGVLMAIADDYAQVKDYTQALQIAKALNFNNQASALIKIATVYAKNDDKGQAVIVLSETEKLLNATNFSSINLRLFADIAHLYAELGDKGKSIILLENVRQQLGATSKKDVLDLVHISAEFAALEQTAQVEEIFSRILKITEQLKDPTSILVDVARTYAETGQIDKAEKLFSQLLKYAKRTIFPAFKTNIFLGTAEWYAKLGQPDRALELLNTLDEDFDLLKVTSLNTMVESYAKVGNLQKALALIETALQNKYVIDKTLEPDFIMKSYIFLEKYDKALQIAKLLPPEKGDRWIKPLTCANGLSSRERL
ncbi:tetratricopeptide repeat protein [Nostoc sp. DSM 114161]|uniref:tetratricopeptide repeat protein n=1 Tax=Nostoc sp. DSM 114161 TaxID=3440143 RepID=UPI00404576EF